MEAKNWISAETPPTKQGGYLTYPHYRVLSFDDNDGNWDSPLWNEWSEYHDMAIKVTDVMYWMELPAPPTK